MTWCGALAPPLPHPIGCAEPGTPPRLTKQGVRDLGNAHVRRPVSHRFCAHKWEHQSGCDGCWAESFRDYATHAHKHEERCTKCGQIRLVR